MLKKIIIAIIALAIIGVGADAFVGQDLLGTKKYFSFLESNAPSDPQALIREALLNSLDVESAAFEGEISLSGENSLTGDRGNLNLDFAGRVSDATAVLPNLEYTIKISGSANQAGQAFTAGGILDFRILDKTFYFRLSDVTLPELPAEIIAPVEFALSIFQDNWYTLSPDTFTALDPTFAEVFAKQEGAQAEMRAAVQEFIATNDIFIFQKTVENTEEEYLLKVAPNFDIFTTEEFLNVLNKISTDAPNEAKETILASLQSAIEIFKQIDPTIVLRIGKNDRQLHGYELNIDIDLSEIEQIEGSLEVDGTFNLTVKNNITEINQPQTISAPENFVEFNPLALFGAALPISDTNTETSSAVDDPIIPNEEIDKVRR